MRLVVHTHIPVDASLARSWNELVEQMECREVFYTYEWALAVQRAYGTVITPWLFLAYEGTSLIGVVALATTAKTKKALFLASTTADYCDFISKPERRPEFVHAVLTEVRKLKCPSLVLANLPENSATAAALRALRGERCFIFSRPAYLCAQVAIQADDQRKSTKQSVRRRLLRFRKFAGQVRQISVTHARSAAEIERLFPGFVRAHVARFLTTGRISNLAQVARRNFLVELSSLLSQSERVVLSRFVLDELPIAWNFGFQFGGSWFWYQPTFDTDFRQYSPGVWLLSAIVDEACDTPEINRVDLGLGAEGYKDRLANDFRQTLHLTATRSLLVYLSALVKYRAASAVKSMPRVEGIIRVVAGRLSSAHSILQTKGIAKCLSTLWMYCATVFLGEERMLFLEWGKKEGSDSNTAKLASANVKSIDLNLLADATIHYEGDSETATYLLRAAKRVAAQEKGFALLDDTGIALYFCWIMDFDSFVSPRGSRIRSPSHGTVLIMDCWIPASTRGNGYYEEEALFSIASHLRASGKQPWIAVPARDTTTTEHAEAACFVPRFSAHSKHQSIRNVVEAPLTGLLQKERDISSAA